MDTLQPIRIKYSPRPWCKVVYITITGCFKSTIFAREHRNPMTERCSLTMLGSMKTNYKTTCLNVHVSHRSQNTLIRKSVSSDFVLCACKHHWCVETLKLFIRLSSSVCQHKRCCHHLLALGAVSHKSVHYKYSEKTSYIHARATGHREEMQIYWSRLSF